MSQKKMEEKQFLQIDYAILAVKKIRHNGKEYNFTDALKTTYVYLKGWKEAFPSHNKIANVFGITRDAAKERVKILETMGLIERIIRPGQSNFYIVKEIVLDNIKGRSYSENKGTRHEVKEQEAVTETSPQELQQIATKRALPSNDEDVPDFAKEESHCEHQTESPPETQKEEIAKTVSVYPWGSQAVCKSNGQVKEDVKQWALSQTGGDVSKAESLVSEIANEKTGGNLKYSFKCEESVYDDFNVPF